jgi:hypothetical protein
MKHGDLVRNIELNRSGMVVGTAFLHVLVEYADGSRKIHHTRSLELNPTDELQENEKDNQ